MKILALLHAALLLDVVVTNPLAKLLRDGLGSLSLNVIHNCNVGYSNAIDGTAELLSTHWQLGPGHELKTILRRINQRMATPWIDFLVVCWLPSVEDLLSALDELPHLTGRTRWILPLHSKSNFIWNFCQVVLVNWTSRSAFAARNSYAKCDTEELVTIETWDEFGNLQFNGSRLRQRFEMSRSLSGKEVVGCCGYGQRRTNSCAYSDLRAVINVMTSLKNATVKTVLSKQIIFKAKDDKSVGLIWDVYRRALDILFMNIFPTSDLQDKVHFSRPYRYDTLTFYAPFPAQVSQLYRFILPFHRAVWLALALAVLLVAAVSFRAGWCSSFAAAVSWIIGAILHQSFTESVKQSSARLALSGWLLVSVAVSACYTGYLTSYHNSPPTHQPIDNLDRLVNALSKERISVCVANMSAYHSILRENGSDILRTIRRHVYAKRSTNVRSMLECIENVRRSSHVILSTDYHMEWVVPPPNEYMIGSRDNIYTVPFGLTMPLGSPYKQAIDEIVTGMFEAGIFQHLWYMGELAFWNVSVPRGGKQPSVFRAIHASDISAVFYIYIFGCTLALSVLILENVKAACID